MRDILRYFLYSLAISFAFVWSLIALLYFSGGAAPEAEPFLSYGMTALVCFVAGLVAGQVLKHKGT